MHNEIMRALGNLEGKVDAINRRFDTVNQRLDKQQEKIDAHQTFIDNIGGKIALVSAFVGIVSVAIIEWVKYKFFK